MYPGLPGEERYRRLIEENGRLVPVRPARATGSRAAEDGEEYAKAQASESERQKAARGAGQGAARNTPRRSTTSSASTTSR